MNAYSRSLDEMMAMTYKIRFDFMEFSDGFHIGGLKTHLEQAIKILEYDAKHGVLSIEAHNYNCSLRIYKKCLKDFGKVYNLDNFEEDYPEWCI